MNANVNVCAGEARVHVRERDGHGGDPEARRVHLRDAPTQWHAAELPRDCRARDRRARARLLPCCCLLLLPHAFCLLPPPTTTPDTCFTLIPFHSIPYFDSIQPPHDTCTINSPLYYSLLQCTGTFIEIDVLYCTSHALEHC